MKHTIDPAFHEALRSERRQLLEVLRSTKFSSLSPHISHCQVIPSASYSPWYSDPNFKLLYESVRSNTLVDIYRCFELWSLVQRTSGLSGDIIEIGVWRGGTAAIMAGADQMIGRRSQIHLFDTFTGVVKSDSQRDTLYQGGEHADTSEAVVRDLMARQGLSNYAIHIGIFPDESGAALPDRVRFCHIDVDTYGSAKACMEFVWPRLCQGGVMVFDDYGFWGCEGVTDLLNQEAPKDALLIHNLNGHGILIKVPS